MTELLSKTEVSQLTEKARNYVLHLEKSVQDAHDDIATLKTDSDKKRVAYEARLDALILQLQNGTVTPSTLTVAANPSLNSSQPTFSGKKDEEVLAWVVTTETNLTIGQIDPKDHVTHASAYLRGAAEQDYITFKTVKTNPSWKEFVDNLKARFLPTDFQQDLLSKILNMRCTGQLDEFLEKFKYLMNQTENLPEVAKIQYLINTLSGASREYLELRRPKTFKEAIDKCMVFANTKRNQQTPVETNYTEN